MEKTITVGSNELKLRSSLLSIISYKNIFGTDLFADFQRLEKVDKDSITEVIQVLFQVIYVLNRPYSKKEFLDFLDDIDFNILTDTNELKNIMEVIGQMLGSVKKGNQGTTKTPR